MSYARTDKTREAHAGNLTKFGAKAMVNATTTYGGGNCKETALLTAYAVMAGLKEKNIKTQVSICEDLTRDHVFVVVGNVSKPKDCVVADNWVAVPLPHLLTERNNDGGIRTLRFWNKNQLTTFEKDFPGLSLNAAPTFTDDKVREFATSRYGPEGLEGILDKLANDEYENQSMDSCEIFAALFSIKPEHIGKPYVSEENPVGHSFDEVPVAHLNALAEALQRAAEFSASYTGELPQEIQDMNAGSFNLTFNDHE
jgi:hypothetical protein